LPIVDRAESVGDAAAPVANRRRMMTSGCAIEVQPPAPATGMRPAKDLPLRQPQIGGGVNHGRRTTQPLTEFLGHDLHLDPQLLKPTETPDVRGVVPQIVFEFPDDRRDGVTGKRGSPVDVIAVDAPDQADARHLDKNLDELTATPEPLSDMHRQREVRFDDQIA